LFCLNAWLLYDERGRVDARIIGVRHHQQTRDSAMKGTAMSSTRGSNALIPVMTILCGAGGVAAAVLIAGAAVAFSPRQASALPAYAQQTGLRCGRCHVNPAGGGPNTAFGKAFAANGHKVPAKKK
jgi:hypothetical protein